MTSDITGDLDPSAEIKELTRQVAERFVQRHKEGEDRLRDLGLWDAATALAGTVPVVGEVITALNAYAAEIEDASEARAGLVVMGNLTGSASTSIGFAVLAASVPIAVPVGVQVVGTAVISSFVIGPLVSLFADFVADDLEWFFDRRDDYRDARGPFIGGGSTESDLMKLTGEGDTFAGSSGADKIEGNGGNDTLWGEDGRDTLDGGPDDDSLFGNFDNDTMRGDAGEDFLVGGGGKDKLSGGADNDMLYGGKVALPVDGRFSNMNVGGERGSERFERALDATLDRKADQLDGGPGDDFLIGGPRDRIRGGSDSDVVVDLGAEYVSGGAGRDYLVITQPVFNMVREFQKRALRNDFEVFQLRSGGTLIDEVDRIMDARDQIDFSDRVVAGPGPDKMVFRGVGRDLEVHGSVVRDKITGWRKTDILYGGPGNDTLEGLKGRDILAGETGNDTVEGGPHNDVLYGGYVDDIFGDVGRDSILGGKGRDTIYGGEGVDTLKGGDEADLIYGDWATVPDSSSRSVDSDQIFGEDGKDTIYGGAGGDVIFGGAHGDVIYGDYKARSDPAFRQADIVDGGEGDDAIHLGGVRRFEAHQARGGDGDDTFFLTNAPGRFDGGDDNDRFFIDGAPENFEDHVSHGGIGDDKFDISSGAYTTGGSVFSGGPGNDTFWHHGTGGQLSGGPGDDIFTVYGYAATVSGGPDWDVLDLREAGAAPKTIADVEEIWVDDLDMIDAAIEGVDVRLFGDHVIELRDQDRLVLFGETDFVLAEGASLRIDAQGLPSLSQFPAADYARSSQPLATRLATEVAGETLFYVAETSYQRTFESGSDRVVLDTEVSKSVRKFAGDPDSTVRVELGNLSQFRRIDFAAITSDGELSVTHSPGSNERLLGRATLDEMQAIGPGMGFDGIDMPIRTTPFQGSVRFGEGSPAPTIEVADDFSEVSFYW